MKELHTNTVVIGGGPAGYSAAFRLSDLGIDTVLIEKNNVLGGVCLHNGCIPSKYLLHIANVIEEAKRLKEFGIKIDIKKINFFKMMLEKNKIINKLNNGLEHSSKHKKVSILYGSASFESDNSIIIDNCKNDNSIYTRVFFKHAVISSGSSPILIPNIPYTNPRVWDSTDALNFLNLPKKMLIIGSGVIGMEIASIYSSFGSEIDVVERSKVFFSTLDNDISNIFKNSFSSRFRLLLGTTITKISETNDGLLVSLTGLKNFNRKILYDVVLVAAGRKANIESLKLENVSIDVDTFGHIKVDDKLCTNIKNIYAIGDVVGNPMLAHKGSYQGKLVAEIIFGKNVFYDPKVIPYIIYSIPEVAWVGTLEMDAIKNDIDYKVSKFPWSFSGRSCASRNKLGLTKLIFDKSSNRIIGGAVIGVGASEILGEISLAIEMCCDAEDISLTMHAHPTLYETISITSEIFQDKCIDI